MLPFHISDIKDFQVPCHATVNALVLVLISWRKNKFSSSLLTLVTEGSTQDENDMSLQWFLIKFILILGKLLLRQF